jgi:hypothetical protein
MCISPVVARQWLGELVPTAMNAQATVKEYFDMTFSIKAVSYEKKVGC